MPATAGDLTTIWSSVLSGSAEKYLALRTTMTCNYWPLVTEGRIAIMTLLFTDPLFLEHDTGRHPETADRLRSIIAALKKAGLIEKCAAGAYQPLTEEAVRGLHAAKMVQQVKQVAEHGGGHLDPDTVLSP